MNVLERMGRIGLAPRTVYLIGVGLMAASIGLPLLALWQGLIRYEAVGVDDATRELRPELMLLPGGSFRMGSPADEPKRGDNEGPQHEVTVSPFFLCRTEITQENWQAVMGENPSNCDSGCDKLPVHSISWLDAVDFMNRLTELENTAYASDKQMSLCYEIWGEEVSWDRSCTGYRLPTEAEWEYAARAGTVTAYSFGNDASELGEYAWHAGNSDNRVHEVGTKRANPWGLYDMHGNVWEWVWDWYDRYGAQAATDLTGPGDGSTRILRGGSFFYDPWYLRAALRLSDRPVFRDLVRGLGVRCARAGPRASSPLNP